MQIIKNYKTFLFNRKNKLFNKLLITDKFHLAYVFLKMYQYLCLIYYLSLVTRVIIVVSWMFNLYYIRETLDKKHLDYKYEAFGLNKHYTL